MKKIKTKHYDILIGHNFLLDKGNLLLEKHTKKTNLFVVTDDKVFEIYYALFQKAFSNYKVNWIIIPAGEESKSLFEFERVTSELLKRGFKKDDVLISFGGGVVGDLTGFVASSIYRGVKYINIPTTLLSQVDSSIGGKTAVNSAVGKNMIGSFYMPTEVWIDSNLLNTLEEREFNNGMAEVIKAALIGDKNLFDDILHKPFTASFIKRAILVKKRVVDKDPFEKNLRKVLNFGHTYGHAIERIDDFKKFKHGEAISYGMLIALNKGIDNGLTPNYIKSLTMDALLKFDLIDINENLDEFLKLDINFDKKVKGNTIDFIYLKEIGKPVIKTEVI